MTGKERNAEERKERKKKSRGKEELKGKREMKLNAGKEGNTSSSPCRKIRFSSEAKRENINSLNVNNQRKILLEINSMTLQHLYLLLLNITIFLQQLIKIKFPVFFSVLFRKSFSSLEKP